MILTIFKRFSILAIAATLGGNVGFGGVNYGFAVFIGTSITQGTFPGINTNQVVAALVSSSKKYSPMVNSGVSGDTSVGGLSRLETQALAYFPSMVSIEFGTNDPVFGPVPVGAIGVAGSYMDNMSQMIVKSQRAGARVTVWVPILAQDPTRNAQVEPYRVAARSLAATYGTDIFDTYADMAALPIATQNSYFQEAAGSGLHFSLAGNAWAAGLVGAGNYFFSFTSQVHP